MTQDNMKHVLTFEGEQAQKILTALDTEPCLHWKRTEDNKLELWAE